MFQFITNAIRKRIKKGKRQPTPFWLKLERQRRMETRLEKVRAGTRMRNTVKAYLARQHGVAPRRIVLCDRIDAYVGKHFTGRYVIKNKIGSNTKVNFV